MAGVTVILSGGLDSTTLLAELVTNGVAVTAVSFNYNQRHMRELECAKNICAHYKVPHSVVGLSSLALKSALTDPTSEIPRDHYTHDNQRQTVVPNRNLIMLSIAAGLAAGRDEHDLFIGVHANDYAIYPDCRPAFIRKASEVMQLALDDRSFTINAPYVMLTKAQIVRIGLSLKVPYELTHTCYVGEEVACGTCASCQERLEAFAINNAVDPLPYVTR